MVAVVEATAAAAGAETTGTTKLDTSLQYLKERRPSLIGSRRMRYGEGFLLFTPCS
jgi:hypothetical protein